MANVRAFRSGNWSDTSVATSPWSNGTAVFAPSSADDVWAAGFTVTIDQAVTVLSLRNIGSASQAWKDGGTAAAANGGGYSMPVAYNITATNSVNCGNATCLTYSASGSATLTSAAIGNSQTNNINCINITGSGTLTISASSLFGSSGGSPSWVVNVTSGGLILNNCTLSTSVNNFQGCVLVGAAGTLTANNCTISGGTYLGNGLQNNGVSTLNSCTINAQVAVSSTSVINNATGILNINNSTITGIGALSNAGGTVNAINCTFTASAYGTPFTSGSGINIVSGYFYDSSVGFPAIYLYKWRMGVSPTNGIWRIALNGSSTYVNLYTSDNSTALNQAVPTDVRSGVVYGIGGTQTGRLTVPARGSVSLNVNYGPSMPFTATRSGTTATATLAYSYPLVVGDSITVTGASNTEWNSTYTIASVVSATSVTFTVPNTHSSTAGVGANMQTTGTAVLDPAAVASAVWGAASRTITGGVVDTATTLTNAPASVTPSDIWSHATRTITGLPTTPGTYTLTITPRTTAGTGTGVDYDELYGFAKGAWGELRFGQEDSAASLLQVRRPASQGLGESGDWDEFLPSSGYVGAGVGDGNDATKIIYLSPQMMGFDFGVSYAPNRGEGERADNATSTTAYQRDYTGLTNDISAALRYRGTFGGVGVQASLVGQFADPAQQSATGASVVAKDQNITAYSAGLLLRAYGFAVGGDYTWGNYRTTPANGSIAQGIDGSSQYALGITYTIGALTIGGVYSVAEQDNGGSVDDRTQTYMGVGAAYVLAPGMTLFGSFNQIKDENIPTAAPTSAGATKTNFGTTASPDYTRDITVLVAGVRIAF